ncbi:MAG: HTH domain-containing protein [Dehalococcoidia bacterium]|nr:MAG: HTH domain-containing protein [Dehalococcoidia bacterium]
MTDMADLISVGYERPSLQAIEGYTGSAGTGSVFALPVLAVATALERRPGQVRSDALPEHIEYRDEGCDLFASCLTCPLPRCRYDEPGGVRAMMNRERDHQIRALREDPSLSVDDIADRFGVSRRTVFRALEGHVTRCARVESVEGEGQRSA